MSSGFGIRDFEIRDYEIDAWWQLLKELTRLTLNLEHGQGGHMSTEWTHKDLDLWRQSMALAEKTYRVTRSFPAEEQFGLSAQMRRAASSVISNIAEGAARRTRPDFLNFPHIARGSLAELDAQATLASRLELSPEAPGLADDIERVGRMLTGLIGKLRGDPR